VPDQFIEHNGTRYKLAPPHRVKVDDSNLPSYQGSFYRDSANDLEFIADIYAGSKAWVSDDSKAKTYLPPFSKEGSDSYKARLKRSLFNNFFAPACKGFPGFLADLQGVETLHPNLVECLDDIDLCGNNFVSFLWQCDLKVIRDGFCGILIDMPRIPRDDNGKKLVRTLADQKTFKTRPYLVLLDRRNILSASCDMIQGKLQLHRVTIREYVDQPVGKFGTETITRYKTFGSDGSYCVEVLIEQNNDILSLVLEEGFSDLKECPIVLYSATDINPLEAEPPLYNLAEKNRYYYELASEYRDIIHKMNVPVPVRVGLMQPGNPDQVIPPMILGAGVDVPQNGNFFFAELQGNVLETDRTELTALEISMNADSLRFLSSGNGGKTATEAILESTQVKANLNGMATLKESALQEISAKWGAFSGDKGYRGECKVNRDLLKMPLTEGEINALSKLATESHISVISLLEMLKAGDRLPEGIQPSQEIQRLAAQFKLRLKQQKEALALVQPQQPEETDALKSKKEKDTKNGFATKNR
jgi:Domain of unknown function (DUF4055)